MPLDQDNNRNSDGTFKEGHSGNLNGRPRGTYSIMTIIRKKMEEIPLGQTKPWKEQMADIIMDEAIIKRNDKMLKMITEYMDGMPDEFIDITTGGDKLSLNDSQFGQLIAAATARVNSKKSSE